MRSFVPDNAVIIDILLYKPNKALYNGNAKELTEAREQRKFKNILLEVFR